MTPPPPLPSWFGPRASTDDPAVAALLDQVAPARTWQDIGGEFNLNVRLDAAAPLVLRVHRPWATRGRVAGLRRLRERLQRAGIRTDVVVAGSPEQLHCRMPLRSDREGA